MCRYALDKERKREILYLREIKIVSSRPELVDTDLCQGDPKRHVLTVTEKDKDREREKLYLRERKIMSLRPELVDPDLWQGDPQGYVLTWHLHPTDYKAVAEGQQC